MTNQFDIFCGFIRPVWVETAADLDSAIKRMDVLAKETRDIYFVFGQKEQQIVAQVNSLTPPERAASK